MTIRQWIYRLYLKSPGWALTRWLRKGTACDKCESESRLELHHKEYHWHNRHKFLRWFIPNMVDRMSTLCSYHHMQAHKKGTK